MRCRRYGAGFPCHTASVCGGALGAHAVVGQISVAAAMSPEAHTPALISSESRVARLLAMSDIYFRSTANASNTLPGWPR